MTFVMGTPASKDTSDLIHRRTHLSHEYTSNPRPAGDQHPPVFRPRGGAARSQPPPTAEDRNDLSAH